MPSSSSFSSSSSSSSVSSPSSTTSILIRKRLHFFNHFLDKDGDGIARWTDLQILLDEVAGRTRRDDFVRAKMAIIGMWHAISGDLHEDEITAEEWLTIWEHGERKWEPALEEHVFDFFDPSGDLFIDESEYIHVLAHFGRSRQEALDCFDRIGRLPTGEFVFAIDRKRFGSLWKEFFFSEDEEADGSSLFGVLL